MHQGAHAYRSQTVWFFQATISFDDINQLLLVPHICVQSLELIDGCLVIVAIQHSTNHNHKSWIWQLLEVTSHFVTHSCTQIRYRSLVSSPSLLPHLPNLACTFVQNHHNPLSPDIFGIVEIFQMQQGYKSLQRICNRRLPVLRSISKLFQTVLSRDNGPMLLLQKPSHPYVLPLVKWTKVGLPHPFGKLL